MRMHVVAARFATTIGLQARPRYRRRMAYIVIKTINGRQYRYEQRSWREGKRVRTQSRYLGPVSEEGPSGVGGLVSNFIAAQRLSPEDRMLASAQHQAERIAQEQREKFGETAEERQEREYEENLGQLQNAYGLTLGPMDPSPPDATAAAMPDSASSSGGDADPGDGGGTES